MTDSQGKLQRRQAGTDVRKQVPRTALAVWSPPADRRDPVQILIDQSAQRLQDLVPIRYARMLSSEFAFYRGAAAIMASDLSYTPNTGITVQMGGDCHLSNFGGYASPDRSFVFDVNDFDETLPGPFEFDLKRLVASFAVAGRERGFSEKVRDRIIQRLVRTYREHVQTFSEMSRMDVWYSRLTAQDILDFWGQGDGKKFQKTFQNSLAKAQEKTSARAVEKLTTRDADGNYAFRSQPPFLVPFAEIIGTERLTTRKQFVDRALDGYRRSLEADRRFLFAGYRVVDLARKVIGVGSVGTRCWVGLFVADSDDDDVLMLQLKEAVASVHEPYLHKSRTPNHGQRVVDGQRLMQAASDIMLGWTKVQIEEQDQQYDFYLRQMWDWKESADIEAMDATEMEIYAHMCGWTLARAHCRSGDRVQLAGYLGSSDTLDRALSHYAEEYADQNAKDYDALHEAASAGHIKVASSGW